MSVNVFLHIFIRLGLIEQLIAPETEVSLDHDICNK